MPDGPADVVGRNGEREQAPDGVDDLGGPTAPASTRIGLTDLLRPI
jgi:hypothetical protein